MLIFSLKAIKEEKYSLVGAGSVVNLPLPDLTTLNRATPALCTDPCIVHCIYTVVYMPLMICHMLNDLPVKVCRPSCMRM